MDMRHRDNDSCLDALHVVRSSIPCHRHHWQRNVLCYAEPLYTKRAAVVMGAEEPPVVETAEELSTEQDDQADVPPGIPDFWLNVLRANPLTQSRVSF